MNSIFRKEVQETQSSRLFGEVRIEHPYSIRVWFYLFILLTFGLIVFFTLATYARKERFTGYLVPERGLINIYPEASSTVTGVYVQEGDSVKKGDPLVSVERDSSTETKADVNLYMIDSYRRQIESAKKQLNLLDSTYKLRLQSLVIDGQALQTQADFENKKKAAQIEKVGRAFDRYEKVQRLNEQSFISSDDMANIKDQWLSEKMELDQIEQTLLSLDISIREKQHLMEVNELEKTDSLNSLETKIAQFEQQILVEKNKMQSVVTAPISGKVTSVQAHIGMRMSGQITALTILPANSTLLAEIFIPPSSIGFVAVGQKVDLRYDTFPHEKYGAFAGKITSISRSVLGPNQISDPIALREPVYKAKVQLTQTSVSINDKSFPLQAGMTLRADVALDKRPLYQWLLRPLFVVYGRL